MRAHPFISETVIIIIIFIIIVIKVLLAVCWGGCVLVHGTGRFDAVVDFSAYTGQSTREATTLLRRKTDLYVHISTDSVYDVADPDIRSTRTHTPV